MNIVKAANQTRERLLEKAEILFAQRGYHAVSVREITSAAKCNMASVNYHFSNKKSLYLEVFRSKWIPRERRMYEAFEKSVDSLPEPTPELVVQSLARAYLEGPMSDEEFGRHRQLIVRELNNPTEAFELVADQTLRPLFKKLYGLFNSFAPEDVDESNLSFDIMSIFGIILYFNYSRPMISRITGKPYDADFKARLIDHMVRFSLYGLSVEDKISPDR
ncbi:CerR family C-terminal domain-containing protein [Thermodesulfobacteriota bacterium]